MLIKSLSETDELSLHFQGGCHQKGQCSLKKTKKRKSVFFFFFPQRDAANLSFSSKIQETQMLLTPDLYWLCTEPVQESLTDILGNRAGYSMCVSFTKSNIRRQVRESNQQAEAMTTWSTNIITREAMEEHYRSQRIKW